LSRCEIHWRCWPSFDGFTAARGERSPPDGHSYEYAVELVGTPPVHPLDPWIMNN
jgi:hypothetical protein